MKELAVRIRKFLSEYAGINPNWDGESQDDKYTSPDAYELETCAELFEQGIVPKKCWSEWGSGGYKPYTSKEGREEHDKLIKEIYKLIHDK